MILQKSSQTSVFSIHKVSVAISRIVFAAYFAVLLLPGQIQIAQAVDDSTDYIPKEAFCAISLNVKALREYIGNETFPHEFTNAFFMEEFTFKPTDFDHVRWLFATNDNMAPEYSVGVILDFAKETNIRNYIARIDEVDPSEVVENKVDDISILESDSSFFAVQVSKKKVLVSGSEPFVLLMAASEKVKTKLTTAIKKDGGDVDLSIFLSTERLNKIIGEAIKSSPLPSDIKELPDQITFFQLVGKLKGVGLELESKFTASSTQAARALEKGLKNLLKYCDQTLTSYIKLLKDNGDLEEQSVFNYLQRLTRIARRDFKFDRESKVVSIEYKIENFVNLALGGVIIFSFVYHM